MLILVVIILASVVAAKQEELSWDKPPSWYHPILPYWVKFSKKTPKQDYSWLEDPKYRSFTNPPAGFSSRLDLVHNILLEKEGNIKKIQKLKFMRQKEHENASDSPETRTQ